MRMRRREREVVCRTHVNAGSHPDEDVDRRNSEKPERYAWHGEPPIFMASRNVTISLRRATCICRNCLDLQSFDGSEHGLEISPQGGIDLGHADGHTEGRETGHAKSRVAHATGDDTGKMLKLRID